jgi:hypothetical protein
MLEPEEEDQMVHKAGKGSITVAASGKPKRIVVSN